MRHRLFAVSVVVLLGSQLVEAQEAMRYRGYALGSTVDAVVAESDSRVGDLKVLHERPALIQELEWRAPYADSTNDRRDPVRSIVFSFCDHALYQVLVTYDAARTDGLDNRDIISSLTASYGAPVVGVAQHRPVEAAADTVMIAQWERDDSSLTLLRGVYSTEFQLLLTAKAGSARARTAMREAARLDAADAPRRERAQRKQDAADATATRDKIRAANKAAFRP